MLRVAWPLYPHRSATDSNWCILQLHSRKLCLLKNYDQEPLPLPVKSCFTHSGATSEKIAELTKIQIINELTIDGDSFCLKQRTGDEKAPVNVIASTLGKEDCFKTIDGLHLKVSCNKLNFSIDRKGAPKQIKGVAWSNFYLARKNTTCRHTQNTLSKVWTFLK